MMKKSICLALALVLLIAVFAGCSPQNASSDNQSSTDNDPDTSVNEDVTTPTDEDDDADQDIPVVENGAFDEYTRPRVVEKPKVAYLVRTIENDSQARMYQQAQVEAAHRGWELVEIVYETDTNFQEAFRNAVNQQVDAIILCSQQNMEAQVDLITMARDQGIGVYSNCNYIVDGVISNVMCPNGVGLMEMVYEIGGLYDWNLNCCILYDDGQLDGRERNQPLKGMLDGQCYPNFKLLDMQNPWASSTSWDQATYDITQAWLQQYGEELDVIFTCTDILCFSAGEAIAKWGDTAGDKVFTVGFDGGSEAFTYIRSNTPLKYTYAQPFEYFSHMTFEIIDALQVKGLNPGDEGCPIEVVGETLYMDGTVITRENCPDVGESIHTAFDYYDPNSDGWWNWEDGPGSYKITE